MKQVILAMTDKSSQLTVEEEMGLFIGASRYVFFGIIIDLIAAVGVIHSGFLPLLSVCNRTREGADYLKNNRQIALIWKRINELLETLDDSFIEKKLEKFIQSEEGFQLVVDIFYKNSATAIKSKRKIYAYFLKKM